MLVGHFQASGIVALGAIGDAVFDLRPLIAVWTQARHCLAGAAGTTGADVASEDTALRSASRESVVHGFAPGGQA